MDKTHPNNLRYASQAWLLIGWMHSLPGVLRLHKGRLSFTTNQTGTLGKRQLKKLAAWTEIPHLAEALKANKKIQLFDLPLEALEKVRFPLLYFSAGMHLHADKRFRMSFIQPNNTQHTGFEPTIAGTLLGGGVVMIRDIRQSRKVGKRWKSILLDPLGTPPEEQGK